MFRNILILQIAVVCLAGCPAGLPGVGDGGSGDNGGASGNGGGTAPIRDVFGGSDFPDVPSGEVSLRVVNQSTKQAQVLVEMFIDDQVIRRIERLLQPKLPEAFFGPDRADYIRVAITLLGETPENLPPSEFRLGTDFEAGEMVEVVIPPDEEPDRPVPPPLPLVVALGGLSNDVRVNPGGQVGFQVTTTGASAAGRLTVFADPAGDVVVGNEIVLLNNVAAAQTVAVVWTTTGVAPGLYEIFARVQDGERSATVGPAAGRVRINAAPALALVAPAADAPTTIGRPLRVSWTGADGDDAGATVTVILDSDMTYAGDEKVLASNVPLSDLGIVVQPDDAPPGAYFIGVVAGDGLATAVDYAGPLCLVERLVGDLKPAELADVLVSIRAATGNAALGSAVAFVPDSNADGRPGVLLGDPLADVSGAAYFFEPDTGVPWASELSTSAARTKFIGPGAGSLTGASVGALPSNANYPKGYLLLGAPSFDTPFDPDSGRVFTVSLAALGSSPTVPLLTLANPQGSYLTGERFELFGTVVANAGDLDGDGKPEPAIGAPAQNAQRGEVSLLKGGALFDDEDARLVGDEGLTGLQVQGHAPNDLFGSSLARLDQTEGTDFLMIGAPGAAYSDSPRAGVVYALPTPVALTDEGAPFKYLDANQIPVSSSGRVFVGEQADDMVGAAVATGDFNGDSLPDLAIGAPGANAGRGRVYIVFDAGNIDLPAVVALADVGSAVAGVVIDGVTGGDRCGAALASAGRFDADALDELVIGAPGAAQGGGEVWLLYGAPDLAGERSLSELLTCARPGLRIHAATPARLGAALAGGADLNGDGRADVLIGAPGATGGEVHILFGR